jgi:hypothetical protein
MTAQGRGQQCLCKTESLTLWPIEHSRLFARFNQPAKKQDVSCGAVVQYYTKARLSVLCIAFHGPPFLGNFVR